MRLGETSAALRRIPFPPIILADGSGIATSVDALTPTVLVASAGVTLVAAGGTFGHSTGETRQHYYEASFAEASIPGFLLVIVLHANIQPAIAWAPVGQIFALGETNPGLLRLPLAIFNTGEPALLATGATVGTASDLASSHNGGAFATDGGALVEIGHGAYYWQAVPAAALTAGYVEVRYDPLAGGYGVCLSWVSVDAPGSVAIPVTPTGPAPIPVVASSTTYPTIDYVELALSRLPSQYRGIDHKHESRQEQMMRVLLTPVPDLAAAMIAMLLQRSIETAVGEQLTSIGRRVGREREGVTDDEIFRRYVRAQIVANRSDGVVDDILTMADLVINDLAAVFELRNEGAGAYTLAIGGIAVSGDVADVLMRLLLKATSGAVRPILEYSSGAPASRMVWGSGTWGQNWSRARDH